LREHGAKELAAQWCLAVVDGDYLIASQQQSAEALLQFFLGLALGDDAGLPTARDNGLLAVSGG
jgi:hypothetical protein